MKKILLMPVFAIACLFLRIDSAWAIDYPFSVTTTNISANGTFQFKMSASGTFYVDCGTGGTLSGTGVSGGTIDRTSTTNEDTYTCTYSNGGAKTIRFGGTATGYSTIRNTPVLHFYDSRGYVSTASGNLSKIFPYFGIETKQYLNFYTMFSGCYNMRTVSGNWFSDYSGDLSQTSYMFAFMFSGSGLTSIPEEIFSGITYGATDMFNRTFLACTSLTSIPENLFSNITNAGSWTFYDTFQGCTSLTSLPENLFANITYVGPLAFHGAFNGCTGLRGYVPKSMFAGLIANGSPLGGTGSNIAMTDIFANTGLDTTCPAGTTTFTTGYEQYWGTGNGNAVSCNPNIISMTFDGATTTPATCSFGSTFVPPTPAPRPGYVFTGWKVKTVNP